MLRYPVDCSNNYHYHPDHKFTFDMQHQLYFPRIISAKALYAVLCISTPETDFDLVYIRFKLMNHSL